MFGAIFLGATVAWLIVFIIAIAFRLAWIALTLTAKLIRKVLP